MYKYSLCKKDHVLFNFNTQEELQKFLKINYIDYEIYWDHMTSKIAPLPYVHIIDENYYFTKTEECIFHVNTEDF